MSLDNRTAPVNLPSTPLMTSDVIVAAGAGSARDLYPASPAPAASGEAEKEETLWEGRYSSKNFLMRACLGVVLTVAVGALAVATWGFGHPGLASVSYVAGAGLVVYWSVLAVRYFRARRDHEYRLTTRRLFLRTGLFQRRVDQVELIRVKDLFVRQTLLGSWLNFGTVVLISSEQTLPKAHLVGIDEPRRVLDLIWRHTRLERDRRATDVSVV